MEWCRPRRPTLPRDKHSMATRGMAANEQGGASPALGVGGHITRRSIPAANVQRTGA